MNQTARDFFNKKAAILDDVIEKTVEALNMGKKILVFGNGGSAAQAQHFAAELVNKFLKNRPAVAAVSLTTDTSALTSIANDTDFSHVFSRQIQALGNEQDVALGLSTSGNSLSVIKALKQAKKQGLMTVALTGQGGGKLAEIPDFLLDVPSSSTPRVQEVHLMVLHITAQEIEQRLF
ncbi:MAG: SIS domain-containing protein [Candidatus Aminicenantes bacterium]|nr:SIS domain-containing protein [Candidatus Aminicenantes bacterium]